jgi:hypothetical protein
MARTRNRRRRKHRGSQSGRVDRGGRGRPRNRQQAKAQARSRQEQKRDMPPTWGGALRRGLIAAGIFFAIVVAAFGQPVPQSLSLAVFMLAIYVPMGYFFDGIFYRRRAQARQRES